MEKLIVKRRGKCLRCGAETDVFPGSAHCESCIKWWEDKHDTTGHVISFERSDKAKELKYGQTYWTAAAWKPRTSNVFIHGTVGTGKTYLAKCMINRASTLYLSTAYLTGMELLDVIGNRNFGRGGLPSTIQEPHVLLIDDVDKCPWNPSTLGWLWQLLDVRRNKERSTIFTSNKAPRDLIEHLEQYVPKNKSLTFAIMDRMRPYMELELVGESLRKKEQTLQQANQQEELVYE